MFKRKLYSFGLAFFAFLASFSLNSKCEATKGYLLSRFNPQRFVDVVFPDNIMNIVSHLIQRAIGLRNRFLAQNTPVPILLESFIDDLRRIVELRTNLELYKDQAIFEKSKKGKDYSNLTLLSYSLLNYFKLHLLLESLIGNDRLREEVENLIRRWSVKLGTEDILLPGENLYSLNKIKIVILRLETFFDCSNLHHPGVQVEYELWRFLGDVGLIINQTINLLLELITDCLNNIDQTIESFLIIPNIKRCAM